jgi:myo-inositol-1(or 4)-monophosphatase
LGYIHNKQSKSDIVTEADFKSQEKIIGILSEEIKDAGILAEEDWDGSLDILNNEEKIFIIDPLDGTLNYSHGFNVYAVSIGMMEKGEITRGVIYLPETDEMFYAVKGKGAFKNGIRLSRNEKKNIDELMLVTGWPYDESLMEKAYMMIKNVQKHTQEVRALGSAAAELCLVADGRLDGFWEIGLKVWDLAAGVLIAKEANLEVYGVNQKDFDVRKGEILTTYPDNIEKIHEILINR